ALRRLGVHPQTWVNFPGGGSGGGSGPAPQALSIPPFAKDQTVATDEDTPIAIDLASDPIQALLGSVSIERGPAHGRLSGRGRHVTYTPDPDFTGTDSFQFRVSVAIVLSTVGRVTIDVRPVADAPVVTTSPGVTAFTEGASGVAVDPAVTVTDVDSASL